MSLSASTIFALATPAGRGAVAIVRLSGPATATALIQLCGRDLSEPRRAVLRRLRSPSGEVIDEALVLWMPAPASFTGEDCAELHLHGGRAVVAAISDTLIEAGLEMAAAGEFTRRAFENDRLDLTQAEAIADLVEAESGGQRRQALSQLGGALSRRYEAWRETLLDCLALLEAEIDFADEDVPYAVAASTLPTIHQLILELDDAITDTRGERVREGFRVAIIGAPNVGKSSLLNALLQRDAAIVTAIAGTTRDVVEASISLGGQLIVLADTAGLRDTEEAIEAEGVRRAQAWALSADLRIGVMDVSRPETLSTVEAQLRRGDLLVMNKQDVAADMRAPLGGFRGVPAVALTGDVGGVRAAMVDWLGKLEQDREVPAVTRLRHRELLISVTTHLRQGMAEFDQGVEVVAENVRLAVRALEQVTGRTNPEAVLDRVFSSFCIGK